MHRKVKISVVEHIRKLIKYFLEMIEGKVNSPEADHLFTMRNNPILLNKE